MTARWPTEIVFSNVPFIPSQASSQPTKYYTSTACTLLCMADLVFSISNLHCTLQLQSNQACGCEFEQFGSDLSGFHL